jgi:uroporphyrinogen decarboxylase
MTSRERIRALIAGRPADRRGFWLGNPHHDTWPRLRAHLGLADNEAVRRALGDDFRWICAQTNCYRPPETEKIHRSREFWPLAGKASHGQAGPLAEAEDVSDVERLDWPKLEYLEFSHVIRWLQDAGDVYRASGLWSPFFHDLQDLFGMEAYFVKMHTHPAVVDAATDRVASFYLEGTERFFRQAGDLVDAFFFGNDFGTQGDCQISPQCFDRFILPTFKRFTEMGHRYNKQVILHSCGSIHRVIDRLIDSGVDCLHPLQARAAGMDAESLARRFGGRITFLGGVDTQRLLPQGTPGEIEAEVRRLHKVLGPRLIVSPSHEAILPDVPPENVVAMARAATGLSPGGR